MARPCLALALLVVPLLIACGDDDDAPFDTEIRLEQVTTDNFTFDLRISGPDGGEPVILLHGFPETSFQWRSQLAALAGDGYRAIAPDQRGYSATARPTEVEEYNIVLLMLDILEIADALGIDRFHLVGHDWGAAVAWGVAGLAPERIRSLSILSIPHPDAFAQDLANPLSCQYEASSYFDLFTSDAAADLLLSNDAAFLRSIFNGIDEEAVNEYVATLSEPGAMQAALNWYVANVGERAFVVPTLGPIAVPTLFVWSDNDFAVCRDTAEKTRQFVEGPYDFVVLEDVDHWISERVPDVVNQLLLQHMEDL